MNKLSIGWRLTVWNTLAVAALLVVCGALVYGMLRRAMYEQTDRLLESQFQELRDDRQMASDYPTRIPHWVREFKEHVNVLAVVHDASGNVFARTEEMADESVPSTPSEAVDAPFFGTAQIPILGVHRTLAARFRAGDEQFTVVLMASLADMEANLAQVRAVLFTALPLALLLAGGVGYWLSRKALSPIERLRERTDQITAQRLDQRLPVDNPTDELGRLATTINDMIGRLERSFSEIRRFTADASHEIRTPLAVLRTEAEVALGKSLDAQEQHNLLTSILEECQRLSLLTDQLLTLARDDAGVSHSARERIDLNALLGDVVETMRPLAEAKQQTVTFQGDDAIGTDGDPRRLRQVFYNVLDNAIKYTPEGGHIEVRVSCRRDSVTATVRDNGIGIPAEHLPNVFERFYRVDKARTREEGGTGLGLSIAKTIVAAHNGRIELASAPGQGTTCTVTLPRTAG